MLTEAKVTEIFCLADDFCLFFDSLGERDSLNSDNRSKKCPYYCAPKMSEAKGFPIRLIIIRLRRNNILQGVQGCGQNFKLS